jgi:hypothetical protein
VRIFEYSIVADWADRLTVLKELAEPERWTYVSVPSEPPVKLPILDSYMRYTFLQVHSQDKVAEVDDLACFNTGLLTPAQEEIFGVFAVSERYNPSRPQGHDNRKWFLKLWARRGDRILTQFNTLPDLASYWSNPSELVLDPSLEVRPNIDHILRENSNRFPIELGGQVDTDGVPLDLKSIPDIEDEGGVAEGTVEGSKESIDGTHESLATASIAARIALDGAITHSLRLARRSYRVAIPQFYRGNIQLLLPLYMRNTSRADLALTLERHGDWYRATTVLYPDWAYRHARILSRPNSEWLGGFRTDARP